MVSAERIYDELNEIWTKDNEEPAPQRNITDTLQDRGRRYGDYAVGAIIYQSIKRGMENSPNWSSLSDDKKYSLDMIASKISRILNGDSEHIDSWHDIAGYSQLVVNILEDREQT